MDPHHSSPDRRELDSLRVGWETRAASKWREFFVASHPGWRDPVARARQAEADLAFMLIDIDPARLAATDALEIGCGSGRLARGLAPRVRSYTGIDIAPSMIAEAGRASANAPNARFLLCDGASLPAAARDRRYGLALAHAVFIHVPRSVFVAYLREVHDALDAGGQLRFQTLADPHDPTGFAAPASAPPARLGPSPSIAGFVDEAEEQVRTEPEAESLIGEGFLGPRYRMDELRGLVSAAFGRFALYRIDPLFAYVVAEREG